jgi:hypothetical protein
MLGLIGTSLFALTLSNVAPSPVIIDEDATFSGYIEREGEQRLHTIRITDNVTSIHLVLKCPGRDFDLYGRYEELPTLSVYDFRGYNTGGEDINYDSPEPGIWHLMVSSYSGIGHYDLIIEFDYGAI